MKARSSSPVVSSGLPKTQVLGSSFKLQASIGAWVINKRKKNLLIKHFKEAMQLYDNTRMKSPGSFPHATSRSLDRIWLNLTRKVEATSLNVDSRNTISGIWGRFLRIYSPNVNIYRQQKGKKNKKLLLMV